MLEWPLGVVDIVYARLATVAERAIAAQIDGFTHLDPLVEESLASLVLPIGCPTAFPKPTAGWCSTPAPFRGAPSDCPPAVDAWARTIRWWTAHPHALLEPWAGATVATLADVRELIREVPTLRLCVDTGHAADADDDVLALLEFADHVQLRQGCVGSTQLHVDDGRGTIDFKAVFKRLAALDYRGALSVEYFDLPGQGWALEDPRVWACDLARSVR